MLLDTPLRSIECILAGTVAANQLPVVVAFEDISSEGIVQQSTTAQTNNTTAVAVAIAPFVAIQRWITRLSVFNADSATATVTVRLNDNSTLYQKVKISLLSGYTLQYSRETGWSVITNAGVPL